MKKFTINILAICFLFACSSPRQIACENPSYSYVIIDNDIYKYVFGYNVVPYSEYMNLDAFIPNLDDIATADSVVSRNVEPRNIEFIQYAGFIGHDGERVIIVNHVYHIHKEDEYFSRCRWYYGLGSIFEKNTKQSYIDIDRGVFLWEIPPTIE